MKILLRSDVKNIGRKGDIKEVKDGYARNFLIPRGFALKATKGVEAQAASMRKAREIREERDKEAANELLAKLEAVTVTIPARVGPEGKLFGAITPAEIIHAVDKQFSIVVDRHDLQIESPIKALGAYEVGVQLHSEVIAELKLEVVASE